MNAIPELEAANVAVTTARSARHELMSRYFTKGSEWLYDGLKVKLSSVTPTGMLWVTLVDCPAWQKEVHYTSLEPIPEKSAAGAVDEAKPGG